jgi:hypothetical protein
MKGTMIFEWPGRHHLHVMLPLTILLAALLHAGLFFLFSIIYPHPQNGGPDPAQIAFIPPGSPDADRLAALLESSDSAVFAPGRGLDLPAPVPPTAYIPSYATDHPVLDPLPQIQAESASKPAVAGPVRLRVPQLPPTALPPAPTRLISSDALASRLPALPNGVLFSVPPGFDPEPATFLVAIRGDGRVSHIFLQHSSGNPSLDDRASDLLRGLKFVPAEAGEDWGLLTLQWGTDVHPLVIP